MAVGDDGRVYIATTSDTAFTFAGNGYPAIAGYDGHLGFLLAFDASGEEDWAIPAYSHFGQTTFWDVIVDNDGNVVSSADLVNGGLVDGVQVPATQRPFGLLKTHADGSMIWLKHPVEEATLMNCPAFDLGQSDDGAYYLGGFGSSFVLDCEALPITGGYNYYVMRISEEPASEPLAGFTWINNGPEFQFTDTSQNASQWNWSFGDGGTSVEQSPDYTYGADGAYAVTLTVHSGICTDAVTDTVSFIGTGVPALVADPSSVQVEAEPGLLRITNRGAATERVQVMDAAGACVRERVIMAGSVFAQPVVGGTYSVVARSASGRTIQRIVVP